MFCYVNKLNKPWTLRGCGSSINNQSRVFADVAVFQAAISECERNANSCFLNVAVFQAARDETAKLLPMSANAGQLHQKRCQHIRSATAADLQTAWAC